MYAWFQAYQEWVKNNSSLIRSTEDTLSHLSWLLPNRFEGSETFLETFNCVLGIVSLWHRGVANGALENGIPWVLLLGALRQAEILFEMRASYLQALGKWNMYGPLTALELVKLALRAKLFQSTRARFVLGRWDSHASLPGLSESRAPIVLRAFKLLKECKIHQDDVQDRGMQSTEIFPETESAAQYWWNQHTDTDDMPTSPPGDVYSQNQRRTEMQYAIGKQMLHIGEILHMIRPVVYVLALRRKGNHAWHGWSLSLLLDLLSHYLINKGSEEIRTSGGCSTATPSLQDGLLTFLLRIQNFDLEPYEEEELARRKRLLLLYLLRNPIFDTMTRWASQYTIEFK